MKSVGLCMVLAPHQVAPQCPVHICAWLRGVGLRLGLGAGRDAPVPTASDRTIHATPRPIARTPLPLLFVTEAFRACQQGRVLHPASFFFPCETAFLAIRRPIVCLWVSLFWSYTPSAHTAVVLERPLLKIDR
jgi:hypothetical protein